MHGIQYFNIFEVIKSQLFLNFRTGNMILDVIITSIILSIITYIMDKKNLRLMYNEFISICYYIDTFGLFKKNNLIEIETINKKGRLIFPIKFISIIDYILNNKNSMNINELIGTNAIIAEDTNYGNQNDIVYIPGLNHEFVIYPGIKCKITQDFEEDYQETNNKVYNKKFYVIMMYSKQKNIEYINDFIVMCENLYKYNQEKLHNKTKKFIKYKETDSVDGYILYNTIDYYTSRSFDTIFFDDKERFVKSLDFFINNEDWFKKKQCPYHLGIMLYGKPGCGKTSFIKSLINYTDRHVMYINLNNIKTCTELESIFFNRTDNIVIRDKTPKDFVIVLEDIDCLSDIILDRSNKQPDKREMNGFSIINNLTKFNKDDENLSKIINDTNDRLNLSFILNLIDGIIEMPGRIIVMTTNHIDKIDPALIRPGRIDFKIEMKLISRENILKIIQHFYDISIEDLIIYDKIIDKIPDSIHTPAEASDIIKTCYFEGKDIAYCIDKLIVD